MTQQNTPLQEAQESEKVEIIEKGGRHKPDSQSNGRGCGCREETKGGNAYRDLVTEFKNDNMETVKKRYYHQSRVVTIVKDQNGELRKVDVNTRGYGGSSTTRERINKDLPDGFRMVQREHVLMLQLPSGDIVDIPQRFTIRYDELEEGWIRVANWDGSKPVVDVSTTE